MELERNDDASCNRCVRYSHQRIDKGTRTLENKKTSGNHPNASIVEIGQDTEKSASGDSCHTNSSMKLSAFASVKNT